MHVYKTKTTNVRMVREDGGLVMQLREDACVQNKTTIIMSEWCERRHLIWH